MHLNLEINDKNELLHMLCKQLEDSGYVTAEFEKSVLEHEVTAPTALGKGVAIPHGNAKCVIRPAVMVATLKTTSEMAGRRRCRCYISSCI